MCWIGRVKADFFRTYLFEFISDCEILVSSETWLLRLLIFQFFSVSGADRSSYLSAIFPQGKILKMLNVSGTIKNFYVSVNPEKPYFTIDFTIDSAEEIAAMSGLIAIQIFWTLADHSL